MNLAYGHSKPWTNLDCAWEAKRHTAFPEAYSLPNVTCHTKAPSPADDRHQSRFAGAVQKGFINLGIFQDILRLPASACRVVSLAKADGK
jgi:hypothetical protein